MLSSFQSLAKRCCHYVGSGSKNAIRWPHFNFPSCFTSLSTTMYIFFNKKINNINVGGIQVVDDDDYDDIFLGDDADRDRRGDRDLECLRREQPQSSDC